jgi:hypothetical protein
MATTNNNSRVEAGGKITLKAGEEVKISGGNVKGDTVEVDTKNLIVESKQDTYYSNSSGINLGAGVGSSSVSGNYGTIAVLETWNG